MTKYKYKLGFIGAGNMAWAIASAVTKAELYKGTEVIASDIASERRELFAERLQATVTDQNSKVARGAQTIVLAVKPQHVKQVLEPLAGQVGPEQLIVSIMAGVSTGKIEEILGAEAAVVRVMPNLALSVGAGMTAIAKGPRTTAEHVSSVEKLFQTCGQTLMVEEEQSSGGWR